ncbi:ABC transporter substrate-binding protein [Nesterenkonia sp. HG001]|uniref:ABC transporter substrate-binding protein n=1 Tax=Nesterenkonia sp. HG001 TaxID=2983207 RepID=UPI002AC74CE6|nr:ABC transporter substrate-binding protein [Nesterenkonia sp. HG001]MDZ5076687.1 ABC transporter substrate-binding protein [Nesterenkonia sp. HG001]
MSSLLDRPAGTVHSGAVRAGTFALAALVLSACAGGAQAQDPSVRNSEVQDTAVTVTSCGHQVTLEAAPERVILLETAPVTILDGLGVMDRVVARAGDFPAEYYSPELAEQIQDIPSLSEDLDASGHLMLSQEEVVAQEPDLALGLPDGVTRQGLGDAGIAVLEQDLYCPEPDQDADFEVLWAEIDRLGTVFRTEDESAAMVDELQARITTVETSDAAQRESRTAAVLYPSVGGGPVYAYGTGSMAQPQLEAVGLENVFDDVTDRVFEVQTEELVDRDPEVLILLHQGEPDGVSEAVISLPGAGAMRAVEQDQLIVQRFNFTEPASPLTVEGLERIGQELHDQD